MRLLIVKTTSMGDVVHALPALTDMLRAVPGLQVDWLVEQPFAAIPALHPGVQRVLSLSWRKWRHKLLQRKTWAAIGSLRAQLREQPYDLILDLQGLLKSALWARQAIGPLAGYDGASAREPAAAWFYRQRAAVPRDLHAVERCRRLAAAHLGYAMPAIAARLRPARARAHLGTQGAPDRYAVIIPNASRKPKSSGPNGTLGQPWAGSLHDQAAGCRWCCGAAMPSRRWPSASPRAAMATCRPS